VFRALFHVVSFELQRSFSFARIATWCLLWLFPTGLIATAVFSMRRAPPIEVASLLSYLLVPQVCTMLGLLLWATPAIQAELEGKTWSYLCLRPYGKLAVLFGKYCLAVVWAGSASLISSWAIAFMLGGDAWLKLARTLSGLSVLASLSYGALYLLIGVCITKRAMIAALAYSLVMEAVISLVPATINQLTISYRLRSLLAEWMSLDRIRSRTEIFSGPESASMNLLIVILYTFTLLFLAAYSLLGRDFGSETEG
jgi:hypothetical protein